MWDGDNGNPGHAVLGNPCLILNEVNVNVNVHAHAGQTECNVTKMSLSNISYSYFIVLEPFRSSTE
jgi:hypothetical protein